MSTERLIPRFVRKPWGVEALPKWLLPIRSEERIGEVWYEKSFPNGQPATLLVKYLITSERLSVQVHPDDAQAAAAGLPRGKSEAWFALEADGNAEVAIGLTRPASPQAVAAAAGDGSILDFLDWRRVEKGAVFYIPAGTIHAIGAGCVLVEVQQNSDTTYRLFDYGRPRELHLKEGLAAATLGPAPDLAPSRPLDVVREVLVESPLFVLERWLIDPKMEFILGAADEAWLILLAGSLEIQGARFRAGEVAFHAADRAPAVTGERGASLLVAYPSDSVDRTLLTELRPATHGFWDEGNNANPDQLIPGLG